MPVDGREEEAVMMSRARAVAGRGWGRIVGAAGLSLWLAFVVGLGGVMGGAGCEGRDHQKRRTHKRRHRTRAVRRRTGRHRTGPRWKRRYGSGRWRRVRKPRILVKPGVMGTMVAAVDGDTFWIRLDGLEHKLIKARLDGANAPECDKEHARLPNGRATAHCSGDEEFFGLKSYLMVKQFAEGHRVRILCRTRSDGYCKTGSFGRPLLSLVVFPAKTGAAPARRKEPRDLGEWLVENGGAWPFTKYWSPLLARYCKAEERAWKKRAGMWKAGSRASVMQKMSKKTRKWYAMRDQICARAARGLGPMPRRRRGTRQGRRRTHPRRHSGSGIFGGSRR